MALVNAARDHPAVHYVIWNRHIWSSSAEMSQQPYTGVDPHLSHVHISVHHSAEARSSRTLWRLTRDRWL